MKKSHKHSKEQPVNEALAISPSSPQSEEVIRDFLQKHHCGVLSTADTVGNPHAAVMYYTIDSDYRLTFTTKVETQKYKNMEQNEEVMFVCYDEPTETTVQISGRVEKVVDPKESRDSLNALYRLSETYSHSELPPIEKLYAGDYVSLKLIPQVIKMGIFLRPDAEENGDLYEILTFTSNA